MITKKGPFMSIDELHEYDMERRILRMRAFNGKEFKCIDDEKNKNLKDFC